MSTQRIDLDAPIYQTIYVTVNATGTVTAQFGDDREAATAHAKRNGLRVVKTVKELEE